MVIEKSEEAAGDPAERAADEAASPAAESAEESAAAAGRSPDANASEIVEDMLTLMRPRPAAAGAETDADAIAASGPLDAAEFDGPATPRSAPAAEPLGEDEAAADVSETAPAASAEVGFFDSQPAGDLDDGELEFTGRGGRRALWMVLVLLIGGGLGFAGWKLWPMLQPGAETPAGPAAGEQLADQGPAGTAAADQGAAADSAPGSVGAPGDQPAGAGGDIDDVPVAPIPPPDAVAAAGGADEGQADEGRTDEGRTDEGQTDEGRTDEGRTDEGRAAASGQEVSAAGDAGDAAAGQPDEPDEPDGPSYAGLLGRGQRHLEAYRFRRAVGSLRRALKINPQGVDAMVALANAQFELGRDRQALALIRRALKRDPENARAHLTLGTIHQTLGHNAQAIRAYRTYLRLAPQGRSAREVRAILKNLR